MGALKYGLAVLLIWTIGNKSTQEYETISWSSDRSLSWNDFRGKVPINSRAAAITASGITYSFATTGTKDAMEVDFKIDTFFYPTKSWYQPELCDSLILGHEQLHFDISELYARKMKQRLLAESFTYDTVKSRVKSIYQQINKELNDFQNKYDEETNFSRNLEKQEEWWMLIKQALLDD